jgi:ankyrin repeat protein
MMLHSMKKIVAGAVVVLALTGCPEEAEVEADDKTLADLIRMRDVEAAVEQIEAGADPYTVVHMNLDEQPASAPVFALALKSLEPEIVTAFLDHGADPVEPLDITLYTEDGEQEKQLPPLYVAMRGHRQNVQMLLERGAEANADPTEHHDTPLNAAAHLGRLGIMMDLIEHGADVNKKGWKGFTPLHKAMDANYQHPWYDDMARFLVEEGAEVNAKDNDGRTPLHISAMNGLYEGTRTLGELGAGARIRDNDMNTPAGLARKNNRRTVIYLLLHEMHGFM